MDKSTVEPTIPFIEKISFSLKVFSGHFYGQSFIKTVRGPLFLTHLIPRDYYMGQFFQFTICQMGHYMRFGSYHILHRWASTVENLSSGICEQHYKGADQHLHRLISAFVICVLESIISKLATNQILIFYIDFEAEETVLNLSL